LARFADRLGNSQKSELDAGPDVELEKPELEHRLRLFLDLDQVMPRFE
jgi:hypothetical protein